jgi:hypothetical protein
VPSGAGVARPPAWASQGKPINALLAIFFLIESKTAPGKSLAAWILAMALLQSTDEAKNKTIQKYVKAFSRRELMLQGKSACGKKITFCNYSLFLPSCFLIILN